jgi:hypothetical protein
MSAKVYYSPDVLKFKNLNHAKRKEDPSATA